MKRSRPLPDELRFPVPPARIDRSWRDTPLLPAVAIEYLGEIHRWREGLAAALAGEVPALVGREGLSPRARGHLALLIDAEWDVGTRRRAAGEAYNIAPFPAIRFDACADHSMAGVMEVLRWRAAVVDYLSDVWDVMGSPLLELEECRAMSAFLYPIRMEDRCIFCLTEYDPSRVSPDDHGCVMLSHVRAKWPPFPWGKVNRA